MQQSNLVNLSKKDANHLSFKVIRKPIQKCSVSSANEQEDEDMQDSSSMSATLGFALLGYLVCTAAIFDKGNSVQKQKALLVQLPGLRHQDAAPNQGSLLSFLALSSQT